MLDPELKNYLSGINQHLVELKNKKSHTAASAFFTGFFSVLGRVVGWAVVLVVLYYVFSKLGWVQSVRGEYEKMKSLLESVNRTQTELKQKMPDSGTLENIKNYLRK